MITERIAFGRNPSPDRQRGADPWVGIRIDDPYVSDCHCEVLRVRSTGHPDIHPVVFMVRDLGSTNGTWIVSPTPTGHTVRKAAPFAELLAAGDRIRIGRTTLPWTVD